MTANVAVAGELWRAGKLHRAVADIYAAVGGACALDGGDVMLSASNFTLNSASGIASQGGGGAIYAPTNASIVAISLLVEGNLAAQAGLPYSNA